MRTKSRLKRILCLLLTLCMVISMQTVTAVKADEPVEITSVDVSDITLPVVGATPDFDVSLPAGANYHFATEDELLALGYPDDVAAIYGNGVVWCQYSDLDSITGKFEPGKTYYLSVMLIPNDGYKFADSVKMTLNGSSELVYSGVIKSEVMQIFSIEFTIEGTAPVLEEITSVDISDITLPVIGESPDYDVTLPAGANYHFATEDELLALGYTEEEAAIYADNVVWYLIIDTGGVRLPSTTKFEEGKTYYLEAYLIPNEGYEFVYPLKATLNEDINLVYPSSDDANSKYFNLISIAFETDKPITVSKEITSVDISSITLPVIGESPDYDVTLPAGANYHLATEDDLLALGYSEEFASIYADNVVWYERADTGVVRLPSTAKFEAGKTYYLDAFLIPNEGYEFVYPLKATLNEDINLVYPSSGDANSKYFNLFSIDFKADEPITVSKEITSVDISDITLPVIGESPDYDVTLPAGANYHLATEDELLALGHSEEYAAIYADSVVWYEHEDDVKTSLPSTAKFEAGKTYYLDAELIPNEGYEFVYPLTATLNEDINLVDHLSGWAESSNYFYLFSIDFKADESITVSKEITSVDISGITLPVIGESPDYDVTLPTGANYHLATEDELLALGLSEEFAAIYADNVVWYERADTGLVRLPSTAKFEAGKTYYLDACLIPNEGYEFVYPLTATLNEDINLVYPSSGDEDSKYFNLFSIDFKADESVTPVSEHTVTIASGGEGAAGAGKYKAGDTVTITAGTFDDAIFNGWISEDGVVFADAGQPTTTFTMPDKDVTVTATWLGTGSHTVHEPKLVAAKDPTFTEDGNIEYYECLCGKFFTDATCTVEIVDHDSVIIPMLKYKIIKGMNGVYTKGSGQTLEFTANGPEADCTGVKIDGKEIDASNYTRKSGSTIITLSNEYLETLEKGEHNIIVVYGDREEATTTFTVNPKEEVTYTLTTSVSGGHGTISEGKTGLAENSTETVIFKPDKGYEIDKVTVNGVETGVKDNVLDVKMDGNKSVVVTYKLIKQDGKVPPTGDNLTMLVALQTVSLSGLAAVCYIRKKREFSK